MRINEIFYSLQGEGFLAGMPSVFVRLAGCPLRCRWCDTKYVLDYTAGAHYSIDKIVQEAGRYQSRHVVITGGEPMICSDINVKSELPELVQSLKDIGKHVTIETSGIAFIPDMVCDLMSISPKLSNSTPDEPAIADVHEKSRLDTAVLGELIDHYNYQLKFVIDSPEDLVEIEQTIEDIGNVDADKVILMPQAIDKAEFLAKSAMAAELCKRSGFTLGQRLQILLWDNKQGK